MTDDKLKAIKARANAATPGPWWVSDATEYYYVHSKPKGDFGLSSANTNYEDSWFIAHARTDISQLAQARENFLNILFLF